MLPPAIGSVTAPFSRVLQYGLPIRITFDAIDRIAVTTGWMYSSPARADFLNAGFVCQSRCVRISSGQASRTPSSFVSRRW